MRARTRSTRVRAQAVLLGGPHRHHLGARRSRQRRQLLGLRVGQWPRRGPQRLGEVRQHLRVQPVGLGQVPGRRGEGAHLARIDRRHRRARHPQFAHQRRLVAPGSLHHDDCRRQRAKPVHQRGDPTPSLSALPLPARTHCDVYGRLRDIDTHHPMRTLVPPLPLLPPPRPCKIRAQIALAPATVRVR